MVSIGVLSIKTAALKLERAAVFSVGSDAFAFYFFFFLTFKPFKASWL
jgi:hypothetical protein